MGGKNCENKGGPSFGYTHYWLSLFTLKRWYNCNSKIIGGFQNISKIWFELGWFLKKVHEMHGVRIVSRCKADKFNGYHDMKRLIKNTPLNRYWKRVFFYLWSLESLCVSLVSVYHVYSKLFISENYLWKSLKKYMGRRNYNALNTQVLWNILMKYLFVNVKKFWWKL